MRLFPERSVVRNLNKEQGAVAVEFALLLPVLLVILLGIIEFGRVYNAQITVTQAAREGARVMAIQNDAALARDSAIQAASALDSSLLTVEIEARGPDMSGPITSDSCLPGQQVTVRISYESQSLTGFVGPLELTGLGAMRCGG